MKNVISVEKYAIPTHISSTFIITLYSFTHTPLKCIY